MHDVHVVSDIHGLQFVQLHRLLPSFSATQALFNPSSRTEFVESGALPCMGAPYGAKDTNWIKFLPPKHGMAWCGSRSFKFRTIIPNSKIESSQCVGFWNIQPFSTCFCWRFLLHSQWAHHVRSSLGGCILPTVILEVRERRPVPATKGEEMGGGNGGHGGGGKGLGRTTWATKKTSCFHGILVG